MRRFRLAAAASLLVLSACSSGAGVIERAATTAATTTVEAATTTSATTALAAAIDGPRTLGDPVLPAHGNGGYDATHYDVSIDATDLAASGSITARTEVALAVAQPLASLSLDFVGFEIAAVTVDGEPVPHHRSDAKLIIEPNEPIVGEHRLAVTYSGRPTPVNDESAPGTLGWMSGTAGTYLVAEPGGLMSVIPCNDHPSDPATFSFSITAAAGLTVATSGVAAPGSPKPASAAPGVAAPEAAPRSATAVTWSSNLTSAVPTYAVQIAIGDYDVVISEVDLGERTLPIRHVVPRRMPTELRNTLSITDAQVRFFADLLGTFPDETYGILTADAPVEFALETSTLSMIPYGWFASPNAYSVHEVTAHELAHQWFGNRVTIADWSELWLSEGWATYLSWLWLEHAGLDTVDTLAAETRSAVADMRRRLGPVRKPTPATLWSENQYTGAAIVLHDVRQRIGDDAFFELARRWATKDSPAGSTTAQFVALASEVAGTDLAPLLDTWLNTTAIPDPGGD